MALRECPFIHLISQLEEEGEKEEERGKGRPGNEHRCESHCNWRFRAGWERDLRHLRRMNAALRTSKGLVKGD